MEEWRRTLKPDIWLGAFVAGELVGLASLRHRLTLNLAQLTTLHVSPPHRRKGIARQLLHAVIELACQSDAALLYVSATPSASAVNFYRSQGFAPTAEPNPEMVELEPDDIHMVCPLPAG
jgi:ribosomal protein S18 acetylase RimI-like enzyme